jgi:hypothetical protein
VLRLRVRRRRLKLQGLAMGSLEPLASARLIARGVLHIAQLLLQLHLLELQLELLRAVVGVTGRCGGLRMPGWQGCG